MKIQSKLFIFTAILSFLCLEEARAQQNPAFVIEEVIVETGAIEPSAQVKQPMPPLMIIRFNKPVINYSKQLNFLLKQALESDPNIKLKIDARFAPDSDITEASFKANIEKIIDAMLDAGMNPDNIDLSAVRNNNLQISKITIERIL